MMKEIQINKNLDKEEKYIELTKQVKSLIDNEEDHIANLSNICAAISETHKFLWTGFYIVKGNELVLGPFQGPVACTRIAFGNGVCGTSWKNKKTIILEDVNSFPGHIVCSSKSKSEIVIPIFNNGNVYGVLDVDDSEYSTFDKTDHKYLKGIVRLFEEKLD